MTDISPATQTDVAMPDIPVAQETGIAAPPDAPGRVTPAADHDRVAMASRKADGTPDQDTNFEFIGPKDRVLAAAKQQLAQQRVSAVDVAMRGVQSQTGGEVGSSAPDAAVSELVAAHKAAEASAHADAEAEVNARHFGLGDRADNYA